MKKIPVMRILIAAAVYLAMFLLGASSGIISPACYAYAGTVLPIFFAFVYLYTAANIQSFGAAAILNGFVLVIGLIVGEGNPPWIIGMVLLAALAEIIRKTQGYDTLRGVRLSFIPLAYTFYTYSAHWWTDTEGSLQAAVEEMPAGYSDRMLPVISNIPALVIALILVIPVAILGMMLAGKLMKKQAALLK